MYGNTNKHGATRQLSLESPLHDYNLSNYSGLKRGRSSGGIDEVVGAPMIMLNGERYSNASAENSIYSRNSGIGGSPAGYSGKEGGLVSLLGHNNPSKGIDSGFASGAQSAYLLIPLQIAGGKATAYIMLPLSVQYSEAQLGRPSAFSTLKKYDEAARSAGEHEFKVPDFISGGAPFLDSGMPNSPAYGSAKNLSHGTKSYGAKTGSAYSGGNIAGGSSVAGGKGK